MRLLSTLTGCVILVVSSASAQDSISPKTLAAIKRATVFVKVDVKGVSTSGSGFVIQVDGESALVVTNHHVIEPKVIVEVLPKGGPKGKRPPPGALPPGMTPRTMILTLKDANVTLVFDSGTKNEQSAKAEVVAIDPERDLAVLRVTGVKDLPAPLDLEKAPELAETLPVWTFGYPFGKVLATGKGHPAITIGKAAISSLRENDDGDLALVQIDGALNPGNSGGPIVDVQGRLVGVAVATIRNSSGIGLAIPGAELRQTLLGRTGTFDITRKEKESGKDKTMLHVELGVIDPLGKITTIVLHYLPAQNAKEDAEKSKEFSKLPGCKSIKLDLEKQLATGDLTFETKDVGKELLLQAEFINGSGNKVYSKVIRQAIKAETVVAKADPKDADPVVKGAPPTYTYTQSTGKLTLNDELIGTGYSGKGAMKNDNAKQSEKDGPIPIGEYVLTGFQDNVKLGGKNMGLLPVAGGNYYGRFPMEPFAIIAETDNPPSGCFIVVPREVLDKLSTQKLAKLRVVK
jgi:hypothetical protein